MTGRRCPGCGTDIPVDMYACRRDWARLPQYLKRAISAAFASLRGGNQRAVGSLRAAQQRADRWLAENPEQPGAGS